MTDLPKVRGVFIYRCPRCGVEETVRIRSDQSVFCACQTTSFIPLPEDAPLVEMVPVLKVPMEPCEKNTIH